MIWERKLGTALEALSVLGGRGPWSSCSSGTALPGCPPGGGEGSPHLGLGSVPPAAVTRLAFLDTEGWGTRPLLPMSPVKVMRCCRDFMESPACRGNTFLSAVYMASQSSPAEARARLLLGTGALVQLEWPILGLLGSKVGLTGLPDRQVPPSGFFLPLP